MTGRRDGLDVSLCRYDRSETQLDRYFSSEKQLILVPESEQAVSLCQIPTLDVVAQLIGPMRAGVPASLLTMAWAANGTFIAIAWQEAETEMAVTIHSGSDGSLRHTLPLQQH